MKNTQKIPRKALLEIYKTVCEGWKSRIAEALAEQTSKDIIIEDSVVEEAYSKANADQTKLLDKYFKRVVPKSIKDEINGLKDIFRLTKSKESEVIIFNKPKNAFEKYINACALIPKITEAYNDGTILDWTNNSQYKYLPYWKKLRSGGWVFGDDGWYCNCCSDGSASHHFAKIDNLKDANIKFKGIYEDYYSYKG